jgi:uncharacterized membrane protein
MLSVKLEKSRYYSLKRYFLISVFLLISPFISFAEYFTIEDYDVFIKLNKNSTIDVVETITVNFSSPRHGIYRLIPFKYWQDSVNFSFDRMIFGSKTYKLDIYDIRVDGFSFVKSKDGRYIKIRIGDKKRLVSGIQKYVIRYKVYGAINFFDNNSEFYWNPIGHDWNVPIKRSVVSIAIPDNLDLKDNILIFYGHYGSKNQIKEYTYDDKLIEIKEIPYLNPKEGVTVAIRFPLGYFQKGDFSLKLKLFFINNWGIFIPVIVFLFSHFIWMRFGKDDDFIKVIQYFPPKDITPAEAGVIIDNRTDNRDIISLIFYWAAKGIIKIEEIKGEGFFEKDDYVITKLKDLPEDAKHHEKVMFDGLFAVQNSVAVSTLKNRFHTTMAAVRTALNRDIEYAEIYYKESRIFQILFAALAIMTGFLTFMMVAIGVINNAIYFAIATLILVIYSFIMPKKTKLGVDKYKYLVGFKEFIDKTEKSKLQYLLNEDPTYFDKTLPYAVAFNMLDEWVEKFDGLLKEPPSWYISHATAFNISHFGRSISHSVSTMNSTFTSAPSSAGSGGSGFSGGGSGGGFGGGGGGSW